MVRIEKTARRTYVLDTNVLLHDPASVFRFEEHDVVIPMTVLEELDHLKSGYKDIARTARQVVRTLSDLLDHIPADEVAAGVPLPHHDEHPHGRLFLLAPLAEAERETLSGEPADNLIIAETRKVQRQRPDETVILITKDVNLRVKCCALGMPVEDYRNDQLVSDIDTMSSGFEELGEGFWESLKPELRSWKEGEKTFYEIRDERARGWHPGMLICESRRDKGFAAIVRRLEGDQALLELCRDHRSSAHGVWGAVAHDSLQDFALNLLLDPEMDLVSIVGPAGTGKTFLAMAAALHQVFDEKRFERIVITRETISIGEEIGFLPGTEEEKMAPWMGAFSDNMESLLRGDSWAAQAGQELILKRVQMRSLSLMRGRTFNDTLLIIDEAQNLTPKQVKSLITRAGRNTKIICLGNVAQIDTPYLTPTTCGLTYLVQRFRDWPYAGHVTLYNVERSRLALRAEEVL